MRGETHAILGASFGTVASYYALNSGDAATLPVIATTVGMTIVSAGAGVIPDFDTKNKQINALDSLGAGIPTLLTFVSKVMFTFTAHPKYDRPPMYGYHRTLTHTLLFGILLCILAFFSSTNDIAMSLMLGFSMFCFSVSGANQKLTRKVNKVPGVFLLVGMLALGFLIYPYLQDGLTTQNVVMATAAGFLSHIFGDIITRQGVPLLAPIPVLGKRWAYISILPLNSSSAPVNIVVSVIAGIIPACMALSGIFL